MCFDCRHIETISSTAAFCPMADRDGLLAERQVKVKVGILDKARCSGYPDGCGRLCYTLQFEVGSEGFGHLVSWGGHSSILTTTKSFFFFPPGTCLQMVDQLVVGLVGLD